MTVLIAGGGLAGAAAACLLGPRATVLERTAEPHDKVCGEFLSWETVAALSRLGIDPALLGAAPIRAVRLVHGHRIAEADLPGIGFGLTRRTLDQAVLMAAEANGATVLRGHAVRRWAPGGLDVEAIGWMAAERVLLATGKHELRGIVRAATPGRLVGFKTYVQLNPVQSAALDGHVEIILFPGGYAGLQHVEHRAANLCLLLHQDTLAEMGQDWPGVLRHLLRSSAHLADRLADATQLRDRPLAIHRVPYGFVHASSADVPDVLRLGDQMAVVPSFSGDGMAIALHSAFAAVSMLDDTARYHDRMRQDIRGQIGRAMLLHRAGQRWPDVVAAAARLWPGALRLVARLTRVPAHRVAWR